MNIRWPSKNFWHRTVLGGLCTTITAALIAVSHLPLCGWLFVAGITVVQLVALSEYIQLCKIKGFSPAAPFLVVLLFGCALWVVFASAQVPLSQQFS